MALALAARVVAGLDHVLKWMQCRCQSDCSYNENLDVNVLEGSRPSGRISHSSIMSTVTKSTDPRYAGRAYVDDPEHYAARVAYAQTLMQEGQSHKQAWFHAFQKFPRMYLDASRASESDTESNTFVFPPGLQPTTRSCESSER